MEKFIITILAVVVFISCHDNGKKVKIIEGRTEIINSIEDKHAITNKKDVLSFILDRDYADFLAHIGPTNIIPLETTDQSLIGQIRKILCYDGKIYIHNHINGNSSLMRFTMTGHFEDKIEKTGRGPGEYIKLGDFDIDNNGDIYLSDDMRSDKIIVYDKNFKYIREIKLGISVRTFCIFNGKIWGYTARSSYKNKDKYLVVQMDKEGHICNKYFPFEDEMQGVMYVHNRIFIKSGNDLYINMPFSSNIFMIDQSNRLYLKYSLEYLSENTQGEKCNRFEEDRYKLFIPLKNKIIIQTSEHASYRLGYCDIQEKTTHFVNYEKLKDDWGKGVFVFPLGNSVKGVLNDSILINPIETIVFLDLYKNRYQNLPDNYKNIIKSLKENDNPLLFCNDIY